MTTSPQLSTHHSQPLVSAIIPSYNYGRFLGVAVESALAQTYAPLEVIVVDDGSTDDTRARMATYGDRIRYIYQPNRGLCAARNTGIRAAGGEFISLLDSDDVWRPDKLTRQMAMLSTIPDAGLVSTAAFTFADGTGNQLPAEQLPSSNLDYYREYDLRCLLEFSPFCPSSVMLRRSVLDEVGLFDEELSGSGDFDLWLRVAARYRLLHLREQLTGYRTHNESMSTKADLMFNDHRRVLAKAFAGLPQLAQQPQLRRLAEARMFREAAWMRYAAGHRVAAVNDLLRSVWLWPRVLRDAQLRPRRWERAKSLVRYSLLPRPR